MCGRKWYKCQVVTEEERDLPLCQVIPTMNFFHFKECFYFSLNSCQLENIWGFGFLYIPDAHVSFFLLVYWRFLVICLFIYFSLSYHFNILYRFVIQIYLYTCKYTCTCALVHSTCIAHACIIPTALPSSG